MTKQDAITLDRIKTAHPAVRHDLKLIYQKIVSALSGSAMVRFTRVLSSFDAQAELYAQGRTAPGKKVTNAPAGLSMHNYGLAVDIVLVVDKDGNGSCESASWDTLTDFDKDGISDWMEVVRIFKAHGWEWGGDWNGFKDMPHFQKSFGLKPSDLLAMHRAGQVDEDGYVRPRSRMELNPCL